MVTRTGKWWVGRDRPGVSVQSTRVETPYSQPFTPLRSLFNGAVVPSSPPMRDSTRYRGVCSLPNEQTKGRPGRFEGPCNPLIITVREGGEWERTPSVDPKPMVDVGRRASVRPFDETNDQKKGVTYYLCSTESRPSLVSLERPGYENKLHTPLTPSPSMSLHKFLWDTYSSSQCSP